MNITKHFTTIEGYLRSFERKYKLDRYRQHEDITEPLVCFGMYSKGGMAHIMKHKGLVVIIWSGEEGPDYDSIDVKNRGDDANKILHQEVKDLLVSTVAIKEGRL